MAAGRRASLARTSLAGAVLASWSILAPSVATAAPGEPPAPCLRPPVSAPVVDGFRSPWCIWCRGNRGIEYGTVPNTPVRAAAGGVVRFAGLVARVRYVVVEHPSGLRTTYGRVADTTVTVGDAVTVGQVVGRSAGFLLYFGVRPVGSRTYLDPNRYLLRRIGPVRLIPIDGSPPSRSASTSLRTRLTCTARIDGR